MAIYLTSTAGYAVMTTLCSNGNASKQPSLGDPDKRATALQLKRACASRQKPWVAGPMQAVARSCRCLAACLSQQQAMAYNLRVLQLCRRACGGRAANAWLIPWTDPLTPSSSCCSLFSSPFSFFSVFPSSSSWPESGAWSWSPSALLLLLLPGAISRLPARRAQQLAAAAS